MKPQGYRWLPVSFVALTRSSCSTIRKNFVLVYELLDEMVDYGARHRGQRLNHQYLCFFRFEWLQDSDMTRLRLLWVWLGSHMAALNGSEALGSHSKQFHSSDSPDTPTFLHVCTIPDQKGKDPENLSISATVLNHQTNSSTESFFWSFSPHIYFPKRWKQRDLFKTKAIHKPPTRSTWSRELRLLKMQ